MYDDIKRLIIVTPINMISLTLDAKDFDYGLWYRECKISGFGDMTPQQIVEEYGKSALIEYLDHQLLGNIK